MKKDYITMSQKESMKIHVIQKVNEKLITQKQAADSLKYSIRHIRRMLKSYRNKGISALIHHSRGIPSPKRTPQNEIDAIIRLYKHKYTGFRPTHFAEMLSEGENIHRSKETIRQLLINYELWFSKPRKKKHRKQRPRMSHAGMLVQMDGSHDPWFENRGPLCVLMSFIDDATSTVYAKFYHYEGTMPALDALIGYIHKYGIPMALYADLHQTYHVNNKQPTIEEQLNNTVPVTKFESAAQNLGIAITPAYSPQAKGRVERLFGTLQNRLKSELRLHKIASVEDANSFLPGFLTRFNRRFSQKYLAKGNMHRDALPTSVLRKILAVKTIRHLANDFTLRHNNHIFQVLESTIHKKLTVVETTNGKIYIKDQLNRDLKFKLLKKLENTYPHITTKWNVPKINLLTLKEIHA